MKQHKQATRARRAQRWFEIYQSRHGCAAFRGKEKGRIVASGELETHCDWCGFGGLPRNPARMQTGCSHPGYYAEYQCTVCRYHCHKRAKAKVHESQHGHHVKLVRLYYRINPNTEA